LVVLAFTCFDLHPQFPSSNPLMLWHRRLGPHGIDRSACCPACWRKQLLLLSPACCLLARRYFLAPQKRREGETVDAFAARVQDMIAKQVRRVDLEQLTELGVCCDRAW